MASVSKSGNGNGQRLITGEQRKAEYANAAAVAAGADDTGEVEQVVVTGNGSTPIAAAVEHEHGAAGGNDSAPICDVELDAESGDETFAAANSAPMAVGNGSDAMFDDPATMQVGATNGHDPASIFDDARVLRLGDTDADALTGTSEILAAVPVGKPSRHTFFRTHPEYFAQVMLFEDKDARETYFVAPCMHGVMQGEATIYKVYLVVTRQGQPVLWPIRVDTDGRSNRWAETARVAVEAGKSKWTRLVPDMAYGHYRIHEAKSQSLADPKWPKETLPELFKIAFRGHIIDSTDHPVIRKLLGLV